MLQNDIHIEEGSDNDEDDNTRSHAEPQLKFGPRNGCKKRYDKINVCTFCGKQNKSKITRHLLTHKERAEVLKIKTLPKKSPERAAAFSALVNEGNYKHNISVLKYGSGIFITARRDSTDDKKHKVEDYYPCEFCKGFYVMNLLWHHAKNCKVKNLGSKNDREATDLVEPEETTNFLRNSRTLLYCSLLETDEEELILPVLKRMNDGDVKSIFMRDTIIKKFTAVQVKALGHESIQKNDIHRVSQNARSLSRLVLEAQKQKPMASILGLLAPQNFDLVTKCVSSMSRDSATLPIRMGHLIGHCIMAKSAWAIRICNDDMLKESRDFKQLFDAEWRYIVNAPAIRRQNINSQNKPKVIPETQDLVLLRNYLMKELRETVDQMKQKPTAAGFQWLAKVTMCRLILFNKRRVAEVEDLMVHDFNNRPSWTDSEEFQLSLSHMEKELAKRMDMIENVAKSKKNHHAFVLITPEAKESIMLLIESREAVGIPKSNPYIFARLNASTPLSGGASLKEIVHKCPLLKSPEIIITTTLRRYTATVSQILDMTSKEFRLLAKHLGHDVKTHKEYYQLSSATLELSKVSRILMAVENGKVNEWKDRPMSDISLDELPLAEDEEDVPLDEKLADNQRDIDRPLVHKSADKLQTSMNPTMVIPETSDLGATSADKPTVKRGTKRPWEPEENKQFFEQFAHEIENKEMAPTWKLQKAADTLKSRTVVQIRTRVHNIINDKQKLKH
ncbi:uncharacterized protein LOC127861006 [Dreissena polymorpha]|nr:uncharacterized protein LOC127861006 [Dreissena polymorpha]